MSESQVSRLLRRLGLWARRDIQIGQDGRILAGTLDYEAELLYQQLFMLHDVVLDGITLTRGQQLFIAHCDEFLQPHRPAIARLERQFA